MQGTEGEPGKRVSCSVSSTASSVALQATRRGQFRAMERKGIENMLFDWVNYSEARGRKTVLAFTNQITLIQEIKLTGETFFNFNERDSS